MSDMTCKEFGDMIYDVHSGLQNARNNMVIVWRTELASVRKLKRIHRLAMKIEELSGQLAAAGFALQNKRRIK